VAVTAAATAAATPTPTIVNTTVFNTLAVLFPAAFKFSAALLILDTIDRLEISCIANIVSNWYAGVLVSSFSPDELKIPKIPNAPITKPIDFNIIDLTPELATLLTAS